MMMDNLHLLGQPSRTDPDGEMLADAPRAMA
jgi:hypothetical protein